MFKKRAKNSAKTSLEIESLDINEAIRIRERLDELKAGITITEQDEKLFQMAGRLIGTLMAIHGMWTKSKKRIKNLLRMLFGSSSEKSPHSADGHQGSNGSSEGISSKDKPKERPHEDEKSGTSKKPAKTRSGGNGKNSADEYTSAMEIICKLADEHMPGRICPECGKGKLFTLKQKAIIRLVGQAPVTAFKFFIERSRCICGAIFEASVVEEFREIYEGEKYSPAALAAIAVYKYLAGVTFGTLDRVQQMSGVPLPA